MPSRGGRGGGRGPMPRDVQVSKALSWLLRHGAEQEGLKLDEGGFVSVRDVLNSKRVRSTKATFTEIQHIVKDNDKQRFTMVPAATSSLAFDTKAAQATAEQLVQPEMPSDDPKDWKIRANQGHSIKVESEGLMQAITAENMPAAAVHGTTHAAWLKIVASGGLKPMGRNHVHFASGLPASFKSITDDSTAGQEKSQPVISGMRNSSTVLVFLDLPKAMDAGIKFWLSDNGVILSEGGDSGIVPLRVFKLVEDRTGFGVLVEDGKIVKEAPGSWVGKGKGKG